MSAEDKSKDEFFVQLAEIADAMIKRHGKDFTMGALVLTARFIAENKPLVTLNGGCGDRVNTIEQEASDAGPLKSEEPCRAGRSCAGRELRKGDRGACHLRFPPIWKDDGNTEVEATSKGDGNV